jgi:hypothetical protein
MPLVNLPQFTEMETKIAGPLTFRHLVSLAITIGVSLLVYKIFPRPLSFPLALITFVLGVALGFLKVEGLPLYVFLPKMLKTILSPKALTWGKGKKATLPLTDKEIKKIEKAEIKVKRGGALKNLITKLETKK